MKLRLLVAGVLLATLGGCVRTPSSELSAPELSDAAQLETPSDLTIQRALPTVAPGRKRSTAIVSAPAPTAEPDRTARHVLAAGIITGHVLDVDEDPIAGVCVKLRDATSGDVVLGDETRYLTDDDGVYGMSASPGRYVVLVDAACGPGAGRYTSNTYGGRVPIPVDVSDEGAEEIDVVLKEKGHLAGTITDLPGAPLVGACVAVSSVDGPTPPVATEAGAFDALLDEGWYTLRFSVCALPAAATDWIPEFYEDALTIEDATPVFVRAGRTKTITAGLAPAVIAP